MIELNLKELLNMTSKEFMGFVNNKLKKDIYMYFYVSVTGDLRFITCDRSFKDSILIKNNDPHRIPRLLNKQFPVSEQGFKCFRDEVLMELF